MTRQPMIGLYKNLNEIRIARARITTARQHYIDKAVQIRHQLTAHPLIWPIIAGGAGFTAGFAKINMQKPAIKIWQNPLSRGLLLFFVQRFKTEIMQEALQRNDKAITIAQGGANCSQSHAKSPS